MHGINYPSRGATLTSASPLPAVAFAQNTRQSPYSQRLNVLRYNQLVKWTDVIDAVRNDQYIAKDRSEMSLTTGEFHGSLSEASCLSTWARLFAIRRGKGMFCIGAALAVITATVNRKMVAKQRIATG